MNEHADADEQVIGFVGRNHALGDAIGDGLGDGVLRGAEHLHRLLGALDGHFVEHHGIGLSEQVGGDDGEQRGEAVLVVDESVAECGLGSTAARPHDQVDMGHFIAVTDQ